MRNRGNHRGSPGPGGARSHARADRSPRARRSRHLSRQISRAPDTTRLSIIDLEGGHQPMRHEDTGVVLAFNGEVFSYRKSARTLRAEDSGSARARTTGVILALYLEYGVDFPGTPERAVRRLDLGSARTEARSRAGSIRDLSLYYHDQPRCFAFGSEMKSILTLPQVPRRVDPRALRSDLHVPGRRWEAERRSRQSASCRRATRSSTGADA